MSQSEEIEVGVWVTVRMETMPGPWRVVNISPDNLYYDLVDDRGRYSLAIPGILLTRTSEPPEK